MSLAPIALFTYNRLDHTRLTIEYLLKNEYASDSDLIIYSDGPKNEQAVEKVNVVRNYLKTITGFKSITIVERDANFGLAKSIITGVTEIVNRFGKIIVMEDDLVTSPYFLKYMNESLDYYEKEDKVISIHGYVYPVRAKLPETFFLVEADCWGWATWKRGWGLFESNGRKLLNTLKEKKLFKKFNYNNTYNYIKMLKDQIAGKNNSWAIRWRASAFINNKLTLYPGQSLVENIGNDNSGTHCDTTDLFKVNLASKPLSIGNIPVEENAFAYKEISKYFINIKFQYVFEKIRNIFKSK